MRSGRLTMTNVIVWLCVSLLGVEGTYLTGHTPDYRAGVHVHTPYVVALPVGECGYYRLTAECEQVYDLADPKFRTTYLCSVR
jgi:hypothetical protein